MSIRIVKRLLVGKFPLVCLLAFIVSACSTVETFYYDSSQLARATGLMRSSQIDRSSRWVLPRNSYFYVARSDDLEEYNSEQARNLTEMVRNALSQNFSQVRTAVYPESLDFSLISARMAGAHFVVYPKLLVWDDRLGTWGEILDSLRNDSNQQVLDAIGLDRAVVQIIIMDAATGSLVDLVELEAGSGVFSLYGDQPDHVLLPTLQSYFSSLAVNAG